MGREIRRVPKDWRHPENEWCSHRGGIEGHKDQHYHKPTDYAYGRCFIPLFDNDYETAAQEWLAEFDQWRAGTHEDQQGEHRSSCKYYWEYDSPPDEIYHRPAFETPAVCYQIYETVSEGTPISPIFETLDELRLWLIEQGYSPQAAQGFTQDGSVPSMVVTLPQAERGRPKVYLDIEISGMPK